ncbi:MAG: hypothetical protein ACOYLT_05190 [Flavobacterium sp.]|uniref:hypothetical protein n=1 Tax=Flavobacterium sp. TaxID=239 RepID=UPI003BE5E98F
MSYKIDLNEGIYDYTVQTKKRIFFWWLLLLLLPLLLLLRFEKSFFVKTTDINNVGIATNVDFLYHKSYLYDNKKLLTDSLVHMQQSSGANGVAKFVNVKYSLYSLIFKYFSKAQIYSITNCYSSDTLSLNFHSIKSNDTIHLILKPTTLHIDFKVVDMDDNEPLPKATVIIQSELGGTKIIDSAITEPSGLVHFKSLLKCGTSNNVKASAYGYYPDSIINKSSEQLISGDLNTTRTLRLRPIRKPIVFYVVDCITKVGLTEVNATINFTYPQKNNKTATVNVITNENGVGKGIYDSATLLATFRITGSKDFYENGELPGIHGELPGIHKVVDFINPTLYPKEKRTFCLEPDPNPVCFVNVDSLNGSPIPGVSNDITIVGADKVKKQFNKKSDANGQFCISVSPGESVSISSSLDPYYKANTQTIANKTFDELVKSIVKPIKIELAPVLVTLSFRTIEASSNSVLGDVNLSFSTSPNDALVPVIPPNSGAGEFPITARLNAILHITASKQDYKTNDYTIAGKTIEYLMKSTPAERDIPLEYSVPCNESFDNKGGNNGPLDEYIKSHRIGRNNTITIDFDFLTLYDSYKIYCGKDVNGTVIDKGLHVRGPKSVRLDLKSFNCSSDWITIRIFDPEQISGKGGSQFSYSFSCNCSCN